MFEKASRKQLRYALRNGVVNTEDLWSLSLERLNTLAKSLHKEVQETEEIDFISEIRQPNVDMSLRFDIVKHIIEVKLQERKDKSERAAKKTEKARLLELIGKKEDETLEGLSIDELKKRIEDL